jgi:hypothetical protein
MYIFIFYVFVLLSKCRGPITGQSSLHCIGPNIYKEYSHDRTNRSYEMGCSVKSLAKLYLFVLYLSSGARNTAYILKTSRQRRNYTGMGNVSKYYKWQEYPIFIQVNET